MLIYNFLKVNKKNEEENYNKQIKEVIERKIKQKRPGKINKAYFYSFLRQADEYANYDFCL